MVYGRAIIFTNSELNVKNRDPGQYFDEFLNTLYIRQEDLLNVIFYDSK